MIARVAFAWLPVLVIPALAVWATADQPGWAVMWGLSVAVFVGAKCLSWFAKPVPEAPVWSKVAYWTAWPGLNARGFLVGKAEDVGLRRWAIAAGFTLAGIGLCVGLVPRLTGWPDLAVAWIGMLGIIFSLHFGGMALLSCFWNTVEVQATPLMRCPVAATSVAEFWSARWNTAFRDLTSLVLFRPLARKFGTAWAAFAVFLFSGIVHDLVVSVPARGGYGKPTLYFLIQWAAIGIERSWLGGALGLREGWRGWLFTMLALVLPLGLLFHPEFALRVILPFLDTIAQYLS